MVENNQINNETIKQTPIAHKNKIANILTIIAYIIYIGSFILGIVMGNQEVTYLGDIGPETSNQFVFTITLTYWAAGLVSGTLFLAIAEIIKLLQTLVDRQK